MRLQRLSDAERMLAVSGAELAGLRRSRGLSRSDLAALTGLHENSIANVELGRVDSSVLAMSLLQLRLGVVGVEIGPKGFLLEAANACLERYPFPNLMIPVAAMIFEMGAQVRRCRRERDMSLEDLSRATGLHLNTLWNFERGLVASSACTTYRIFRGLGVDRVEGSERGIIFK